MKITAHVHVLLICAAVIAKPSSAAAHELSKAHSLPSPKKQHVCLLNGKAVGIFSVLACNLFVLPFAVKSI